ncbi:DUF624 domain-containing protein [Paenibacillus cisolokensis]|uniref:YesL family protein n=1 Tax=Paenibacillus cisolokensis TaxID=1658519 RepID=UPI003D2D6515
MEMRGVMGGFYKISEWIMRLSVTNVLWLICSLPFVFFIFTTLFSENVDQLYSGLFISAVVAPFTLFPATAAMFTVARKWVMGEVDVPLFRTFFRGYKENYVQSMVGGILYALLFVILIIDFRVYLNGMTSLQLISYVFLGLMFVLAVSLFNFFSMVVHYHMKTLQLIKNAILITIGKPLRSLSTLIMAAVVVYISSKFTFLIPFFMGSVIAYLSFWNFYIIYQKIQEQAEKAAKAEEEAALENGEDRTEESK